MAGVERADVDERGADERGHVRGWVSWGEGECQSCEAGCVLESAAGEEVH